MSESKRASEKRPEREQRTPQGEQRRQHRSEEGAAAAGGGPVRDGSGEPQGGAGPGGSVAADGSSVATAGERVGGNGKRDDEDNAAEIEGDLDELVAVASQRDEYLALAQRTQADFENYRKRAARESALAAERGITKLVKELLPALDNLDRAFQAAAEDDPLLEGVRLVRSELIAALARVGIESFSPLGESFDPALHEAMATTQQGVDGAPGGTVVEVYQPGYRLGSHIIRPARVVVAA